MWYDGPNKNFYIGVHRGTPDSVYAHSSSKMESFNMNNIPDGFRRRILATGSHADMARLEVEYLCNRRAPINDKYHNLYITPPTNSAEMKARQLAGIKRAQANGKFKGRLPLDPYKIALAKAMIGYGVSKRNTAKELDIGESTLYKYLAMDITHLTQQKQVIDDKIAKLEPTPVLDGV